MAYFQREILSGRGENKRLQFENAAQDTRFPGLRCRGNILYCNLTDIMKTSPRSTPASPPTHWANQMEPLDSMVGTPGSQY